MSSVTGALLLGVTAKVVAGVALALLAVPFLFAAFYLGILAVLARRVPVQRASSTPRTRFDVLVPAHNEELGIARTVSSLAALRYPRNLYRIIVIADNCGDATATRARESGALVLEREDPENRGKGFALAHAFEASLSDGFAAALVVVDADTSVTPNLLEVFDAALCSGAEALQADYGVRNPEMSWRTRLVTLGFVLFHGVRSSARERLLVSCGLRGNGMCFATDLLRRVPHSAFSIVEDLEYGIQLGLAGVRVKYVAEAHALGDMPATAAHSRSQRERWELGRREVARRYLAPLLRAAVRKWDRVLFDLAVDLLVPPLSWLFAAIAVGWAGSVAAGAFGIPARPAIWMWTISGAGLLAYVMRGCAMTDTPFRAAADLAWAPVYLVWRSTLRARRSKNRSTEWVRTSRAPSHERV